MKPKMTECFRRRLQRGSCLIGVPAALLFFVLSAQAQADAIRQPIGGSGGSQFVARCQQGQHLTGFELRVGNDVDAIRPICVTAYGRAEAGPLEPYPSKFGGTGGGADLQLLCPRDNPIVVAMYVRAEGVRTTSVNNIHLFCGVAAATQKWSDFPSAVFDGPRDNDARFPREGTQYCPAGLVAVGINGRSGIYVDALGLICGAPRVTPKAPPVNDGGIKPPRRVPTGGLPSGPICELARNARARNSPAAPGLEAKCAAERTALNLDGLAARGEAMANADPAIAEARNLQSAGAPRRGFDIGIAASDGHTAPGPGKDRIRDALLPTEQGGFSTAVTFSLLRNRQKIADMAPKGEAIANQDPLAAELRSEQREGAVRRGFDIGMAAAEGQIEPVPEIKRIRSTLSQDEVKGYDAAVEFSLIRNKEKIAASVADLAPRGEAIANKDPLAVELREQQPDGPVRRGFDIGMAVVEGHTSPGPGKQKIRNSLTPAEQQGFDVAVSFSLERNSNADLAAVGAVIAGSDQVAAVIRNGERDVFYRLGFDIASGLFGDPKLGARGNTATGPGSLKIRGSLSAAGQRGFNSSVALHLSRDYKR
jgi:hypothetical protein